MTATLQNGTQDKGTVFCRKTPPDGTRAVLDGEKGEIRLTEIKTSDAKSKKDSKFMVLLGYEFAN